MCIINIYALSSAAMNRESFYGWFSTSTRRRVGGFHKNRGVFKLLLMLVVALDLVFGLVRPFVVEPMRVPSDSMAPTLQAQDRVLANKSAYDFATPGRGDLVAFESVGQRDDEEGDQVVVASYYGSELAGNPTASGEPFDPEGYTAAHRTMPFGTRLLVSREGSSVAVTVNDRGPYADERDLDLSRTAADSIGLTGPGVGPVEVSTL
jgi:signal peptidase I